MPFVFRNALCTLRTIMSPRCHRLIGMHALIVQRRIMRPSTVRF